MRLNSKKQINLTESCACIFCRVGSDSYALDKKPSGNNQIDIAPESNMASTVRCKRTFTRRWTR